VPDEQNSLLSKEFDFDQCEMGEFITEIKINILKYRRINDVFLTLFPYNLLVLMNLSAMVGDENCS
jgi:hypothetical protein